RRCAGRTEQRRRDPQGGGREAHQGGAGGADEEEGEEVTSGSRFQVPGSTFRVPGSRFRVRVQGSRFGFEGSAMTVDVFNQQNEKIGSLALREEVFGGRVKADLIHESVVRANAAARRGTHATKNRALVSGSGKKPWRQKGTGRARV